MSAVMVLWPSLQIAVLSPVARSAVRLLKTVASMVVPPATGWPEVLMLKEPEPL